jgi:hypothetical protein
MSNTVYLIKKLCVDSLENDYSAAQSYDVIGYMINKEEADKYAAKGGSYAGT